MEKIDPLSNPEYAYVQAADIIATSIKGGEIRHVALRAGARRRVRST
jgi:hypothetical protein